MRKPYLEFIHPDDHKATAAESSRLWAWLLDRGWFDVVSTKWLQTLIAYSLFCGFPPCSTQRVFGSCFVQRSFAPVAMSMSEMAFHEKAGRSQVDSFLFFIGIAFSPAESPLTPCFHPHSRGAIVSLGACWAFSVQPVLLSVWRPFVSLKSGTWPRP